MVVSAASSIGAHAAGGGYADPTFPLVPLCSTLLASPRRSTPPSLHFTSPRRGSPPLLSPCLASPHLTANRIASLRPASRPLFFCPAASTWRTVALPRVVLRFLVRIWRRTPNAQRIFLTAAYYSHARHVQRVWHIWQKSARRSPFIFLFFLISRARGINSRSVRFNGDITQLKIISQICVRSLVLIAGTRNNWIARNEIRTSGFSDESNYDANILWTFHGRFQSFDLVRSPPYTVALDPVHAYTRASTRLISYLFSCLLPFQLALLSHVWKEAQVIRIVPWRKRAGRMVLHIESHVYKLWQRWKRWCTGQPVLFESLLLFFLLYFRAGFFPLFSYCKLLW